MGILLGFGGWREGEVVAFFGGVDHAAAAFFGARGEVGEDHGGGLDSVDEESGACAIYAVLGDGVHDFLEGNHQGVGVFDEGHHDDGVVGLGWAGFWTCSATRAGRVVPVTEVGIGEFG